MLNVPCCLWYLYEEVLKDLAGQYFLGVISSSVAPPLKTVAPEKYTKKTTGASHQTMQATPQVSSSTDILGTQSTLKTFYILVALVSFSY